MSDCGGFIVVDLWCDLNSFSKIN